MKFPGLLLLIILPLLLPAQEKVFFNARIFTANPKQPYAEAIAINNNIIIAVGTNAEIKGKADAAEWIDVHGGFLMPGFVDHV